MKYFFITLIIFGALSLHQTSFALPTEGYQPLAPLPGLTADKDGKNIPVNAKEGEESGLSIYVRGLYKWGVALTSGLAVIMIMWGGVEYMTSAGGGGIEEAKKRVSAAIAGLLLALGSYIILQTINRDLVNVHFDLDPIHPKVDKVNTSPSTNAYPPSTAPSSRVGRESNGSTGSVGAN